MAQTSWIAGVLLSGLAISGCASSDEAAQSDRGPGPGGMGAVELRNAKLVNPFGMFVVGADANANLVTDRAELESAVALAHEQFDANADGVLSPIEYVKFAQIYFGHQDAAPFTMAMDKDGGGLSAEEMAMGFSTMFERLDANKDGQVARADVLFTPQVPNRADIERQMRAAMAGQRRRMPPGGMPPGGGMPRVDDAAD